jgi:GTP-binding protein HflX
LVDHLLTQVDSFSSTLNEIETADIVLLVEDISHPMVERQREVAKDILRKLNLEKLLDSKRLVRVWNKIDLCTDERMKRLLDKEPDSDDIIMTCVKDGVGIEDVRVKIKEKVNVLFEREPRVIKYLYSEHDMRCKWLKE